MNRIARNKVLENRGVPATPAAVLPPPVFRQNAIANAQRMSAPAAYRPHPVAPVQRMAAPPAYRPRMMAAGAKGGRPNQAQTVQPPIRQSAPPVYRPQSRASQPRMNVAISTAGRSAPPPVYRPTPMVSQQKRNWPVSNAVTGAPPVYRPAPPAIPAYIERRCAAAQPKMTGGMSGRAPGAAPPVYRPNLAAPNGNQFRQSSPLAQRPATIQPVIHTGKTHRSRPIVVLKSTDWYKDDLDDTEKLFAIVLHAESKSYTKTEAKTEIESRMARGVPAPSANVSAKALRRARVTQFTKDHPPSAVASAQGAILNRAGKRAYNRHLKKYKKKDAYRQSISTVEATAPGLMAAQGPILTGLTPWQQVVAVSNAKPQSYNLNLDGSEVTLDSLTVFSNDDREKERDQNPVNLNQMFIEQPGGENSYWGMADSGDPDLHQSAEHQKLRHLEVERDAEAAPTTYTKDALYSQGQMTTEQAFGDENMFTYLEYKGALNPTRPKAAIQQASSYYVLQQALNYANTELGTQVALHPLTTPKKISDALATFMGSQTEANYKKLVKELFRLIRGQTGMDLGSETEADSDVDF